MDARIRLFLGFWTLLLSLTAGGTSAEGFPGGVVRSMPAPAAHVTGLTCDGRRLWLADRRTERIYELDPAGGRVVRSFLAPGHEPAGLASSPKGIWVLDRRDRTIHLLDPRSGSVVHRLKVSCRRPGGLAWDGRWLWVTGGRRRRRAIYRISPTDGGVVQRVKAPTPHAGPLSWDGRYLWVGDRIRDRIFRVDPRRGWVVGRLKAPGPHVTGLAVVGKQMWVSDYQTDRLYLLRASDGDRAPKVTAKGTAQAEVLVRATNYGPGEVRNLRLHLALPGPKPGQLLLGKPTLSPRPTAIRVEPAGQRVALFRVPKLLPGSSFEVGLKARLRLASIRYFIEPSLVGSDIPRSIRTRHLADGEKYMIRHPRLRKVVRRVVRRHGTLYGRARALFELVRRRMRYKLGGAWDSAPRLWRRGTGSCSEYTFLYVALCRAAGIPARYVGAVVLRGDRASVDRPHHRWSEIYLPTYGWIPVDANAGDRRWPADRAAAFGGLPGRYLITTTSPGNGPYLGWRYNHSSRWSCRGRCLVKLRSFAEWSPLPGPASRPVGPGKPGLKRRGR